MGAVTIIVPVANVQVGWINVVVGAAGAPGAGLIVSMVPAEIHPSEFIAVTEYRPGTSELNVVLN